MSLPPILRATHVPRPAEETFDLFTGHIGAWWPLSTHGMFGTDSAGVAFDSGLLVERALDGRTAIWGEVVEWDRPRRLRFTWHPGAPDDSSASSEVEVSFEADEDGTRVVLVHRGWEQAYGEAAAQRRRSYVGPNAWGFVLDHFTDAADPVRPLEPDVSQTLADLEAAYERFWTTAASGGFTAEPEPGDWDAVRVMAHVATNDEGLATITRRLIDQHDALRLDNALPTGSAMQALVRDTGGDPDKVIEVGRRTSANLVLLLRRLDADQRSTAVHAHLVHAGQVAVDAPLPWWQLVVIQANRHLPGHTEQLLALRRDG